MSFEARREISNEQVQNETSDRNATLLTSPINTIRSGIGHAGRFDGDVVGTGSLFKGGSSSKIDQPVDPANQYTQRSFSCRAAAPRSMKIFPLNKGVALKRPWSRGDGGRVAPGGCPFSLWKPSGQPPESCATAVALPSFPLF
jgi:hypothetical protein